jgi:3-hydroxyacyl-CoA dehydrogenase / enoyl-CoA hydratase / 3-hydroxybutyryl-CoA epimerase
MSHVRVEIDSDRIATLWLDAPGKRVNTLSRAMWADLAGAIEQVKKSNATELIVTSAKPNSFCVGADLYEIGEMRDEEFDQYILTGQKILKGLEDLPIPKVAAINGDCLGGGLELALACDERIACDCRQSIGLPETKLGLIPGWGGTVRLPKAIGSKGIGMIVDAKLVGPNGARIMNLLTSCFDNCDHFVNAFLSVRRRLAHLKMRKLPPKKIELKDLDYVDQSGLSFAAKKALEVMRESIIAGDQAGFDAERKAIVELRRTPECREAMQKFFDRKKPS